MYPFIRLPWQFFKHRNDPTLPPMGVHVSQHICWPWDLDMWWELNNGRTLTLYDMGRLPLAKRVGLIDALKRNTWGLTMAGCSVRYRKRIRMFQKIEMRSRAVCYDDRFIYMEQSMWTTGGECAGHILYRCAVTSADGIVNPALVLNDIDPNFKKPAIPGWIDAWIQAEAKRPWPPVMD